ncbi:unnamed protein product, partial [marine sediment metagenome]
GEINLTNVEELIKKYIKIGADSPEHLAKNYLEKAPKNIIERFKGYTIFPLILAGIIDGFNPCAFAPII